jgi:uncharacterized protein YndB with AHSA1/START domain
MITKNGTEMKSKKLEINTALQIRKPKDEVFEAIVDPKKMSNYFISEGSGRMEENAELTWKFPEFEEKFPVRIGVIEENKYISYFWKNAGVELKVEMKLTSEGKDSTLVRITEKGMENNEEGIK